MSTATLTTDNVHEDSFVKDDRHGISTRPDSASEQTNDDKLHEPRDGSIPMQSLDQKSTEDEEKQDDSRPKRSRFQITMIMVAMCVSCGICLSKEPR
jgi:hypothetical protein